MNTLKTLSAATALALSPLAALAQIATDSSVVTIYGRVDASLDYLKFSGTSARAARHASFVASDTSYLGFRGTEDLGSGLRAYFKLEHGFQVDTGAQTTATQFWNRESYVGLGDARLGSVQLGAQYTPSTWMTSKVDPFLRSNNGSILTLFERTSTNPYGYAKQFSNTAEYVTPTNWGGFTGRVMLGAGEGDPLQKYGGFSVEYANDRFWTGLSYDNSKNSGTSVGLPAAVAIVKNEAIALGATYRFDAVKLHGYLINDRIEGRTQMNGYLAGVTVPIGLGEIRASYSRRDRRDAANSDASLAAVGYFYFLSKRTSLYTSLARLDNKGTSNLGPWPTKTEAAAIGPVAGENVTAFQVGMRHTF